MILKLTLAAAAVVVAACVLRARRRERDRAILARLRTFEQRVDYAEQARAEIELLYALYEAPDAEAGGR